MDKGQSEGRYSKYKYLLDNGIAVIQDRHSGIMHNKIAIIDGRILFTGPYNWSKSAEGRNQENLLEFTDEEEIIKIYQERLDYLWEFNGGQKTELSSFRTLLKIKNQNGTLVALKKEIAESGLKSFFSTE